MFRDGGETDPDSDVNVKRLVVDSANLNVTFRLDGSTCYMDGRLFRLFSVMTVIVSVADQCEKMVALITV